MKRTITVMARFQQTVLNFITACNDNGFNYTCKIVVTSYIDGKFTIPDT